MLNHEQTEELSSKLMERSNGLIVCNYYFVPHDPTSSLIFYTVKNSYFCGKNMEGLFINRCVRFNISVTYL